MTKTAFIAGTLVTLTLASTLAIGQTATTANAPKRFRATIESVDAQSMTIKPRIGGESVKMALSPSVTINEVVPIELSAIKPGSFIGTAAMPQPDGTLKALEVHVFPESMRGTGEGHRPFDLQPGSSMTNATVAEMSSVPQGRKLSLHYKDGDKTVVVPEGTSVVTYEPGTRALLVKGANVNVTAETRDGQLTATRVVAGRNGFRPPM
jgi:Cu/Ag efflux protein CusF